MSTTPNLGLNKPDIGSTNWGGGVNDNWDALDANVAVSQISFNMLTRAPDSVGQGTWTINTTGNSLYNGYFYNTSSADGDNFSVKVRVPAGTYTFRVGVRKSANSGILKIYVDDVLEHTSDLYYASGLNTNLAVTGLSLEGEHTIKFKIDGKNASSIDYFLLVHECELIRTGD